MYHSFAEFAVDRASSVVLPSLLLNDVAVWSKKSGLERSRQTSVSHQQFQSFAAYNLQGM